MALRMFCFTKKTSKPKIFIVLLPHSSEFTTVDLTFFSYKLLFVVGTEAEICIAAHYKLLNPIVMTADHRNSDEGSS